MTDLLLILLLAGVSFAGGTIVYSDRIKAKTKGARNYFLRSGKRLSKKRKYLKEEKEVLEQALVENKEASEELRNGTLLTRMKETLKIYKKDAKKYLALFLGSALVSVPLWMSSAFLMSGKTVLLKILGACSIFIPSYLAIYFFVNCLVNAIEAYKRSRAVEEYEDEIEKTKEIERIKERSKEKEKSKEPKPQRTFRPIKTLESDTNERSKSDIKTEMDICIEMDRILRKSYNTTNDITEKAQIRKRIIANYNNYKALEAQLASMSETDTDTKDTTMKLIMK